MKFLEKIKKYPMIPWTAVIFLSVVIDQLAKWIVVEKMELYESIVLIKGFFSFTHIRNFGAAWGMLSDNRWVFIVVTALSLIILPYILYRFRRVHVLFGLSLSLIIGGALGNMIDRVLLGYVVDFLEFTFIDFPVFNIADVCIVIGTGLMMLYILFFDKDLFVDKKKTKEKKGTSDDGASDKAN